MKASKAKNYYSKLHIETVQGAGDKSKNISLHKKYHQHVANHQVVPRTSFLEATCSKAVTI